MTPSSDGPVPLYGGTQPLIPRSGVKHEACLARLSIPRSPMSSSPANALTGTQPPVPEFFEWQIPEKPISIQLSLDVISRMNGPILEAFNALPRRGLEIGGLLLGRVERGSPAKVIIEDFEAVESEHLHGPSYTLSARDNQ